jgi:hypothetical protein
MRTYGPEMRRVVQALALLVPASVMVLGVAQKNRSQYYVKADQMADLHHPKLITAKQNCINWGLAAGLETVLAQQDVPLDQNFWVMRLNYGELCVDHTPSMELLAKVVNQEFVLDDGRHVRLELQFTPGAPTYVDGLLNRLRHEQAALLLWRGHPYLLVGATYDERIWPDGSREFVIKELRLTDTFAKQPAVTFQNGRDDPAEIDGVVSVSVVKQS